MSRAIVSVVIGCAFAFAAHAAPVQYSFSTTAALSFGGNRNIPATGAEIADANALASLFAGSSITGTFGYDASTPAFQTNADGSIIYAANPASSFMNLSAHIGGGGLGSIDFSDPRGFTQVGNETQNVSGSLVDIFQFFADSPTPSGANHNISGFSLGAFSLYNARMFWIEGQAVPEVVPDLFNSSALPGTPPTMHGRMALDFIKDGNAGGQQYVVFFDGLSAAAVPEPQTTSMVLAGLGLLTLVTRRRTRARTPA